MRNRFLLPIALSLALSTTAAHAQFANNTGGSFNGGFFQYIPGRGFVPVGGLGNVFNGPLQFTPGVGFSPNPGFINPGFGAGAFGGQSPGFATNAFGAGIFGGQNPGVLQYNPGQGFVIRPDFVPNVGAGAVGGTNTPTAVSPGPGIQPFPGYGGGYYGGGYYPDTYYYGYSATPYGYPADYYGSGAGAADPYAYGAAAPGVPSNGSPRIDIRPSASSRTPAERRALLAAARRDREEEARITREYRSLARANAVVPGTLVSVRNNIARVRYRVNGNWRLGRFSTDRVYIFPYTRADGEAHVATLASAPGLAHEGDRVMVGLPSPVTATRRRTSIVISNR